jgi:hypothetical protein
MIFNERCQWLLRTFMLDMLEFFISALPGELRPIMVIERAIIFSFEIIEDFDTICS